MAGTRDALDLQQFERPPMPAQADADLHRRLGGGDDAHAADGAAAVARGDDGHPVARRAGRDARRSTRRARGPATTRRRARSAIRRRCRARGESRRRRAPPARPRPGCRPSRTPAPPPRWCGRPPGRQWTTRHASNSAPSTPSSGAEREPACGCDGPRGGAGGSDVRALAAIGRRPGLSRSCHRRRRRSRAPRRTRRSRCRGHRPRWPPTTSAATTASASPACARTMRSIVADGIMSVRPSLHTRIAASSSSVVLDRPRRSRARPCRAARCRRRGTPRAGAGWRIASNSPISGASSRSPTGEWSWVSLSRPDGRSL